MHSHLHTIDEYFSVTEHKFRPELPGSQGKKVEANI